MIRKLLFGLTHEISGTCNGADINFKVRTEHVGNGSLTADEVERTNDMLDVREADGHPAGAFGLELGFAMPEHELDLGQDGPWSTPPPDDKSLRARLERWDELSHVFARARPDLWSQVQPMVTAENMGRALAVRADCDGALLDELIGALVRESVWPGDLALAGLWRGFGFGCGRAAWIASSRPTLGPGPEGVVWLESLAPELAEAAREGWREAARRGPVPAMGRKPILISTLAGPT